jgi:hypothetical protein
MSKDDLSMKLESHYVVDRERASKDIDEFLRRLRLWSCAEFMKSERATFSIERFANVCYPTK